MMNETSITTTAARECFLRIGGEANHAPEDLGLELLPDLLLDETFSKTPSYAEFLGSGETPEGEVRMK